MKSTSLDMKPFKVLVVDTVDRFLEICRANLGAKRYTVITAKNVDSARESYINEHPCVVVVEMELPNQGSETLYKFVRNQDDGRYVPFIFTCSEPTYKAIRTYSALMDDPLVKPFSIDELDSTIRGKIKRSIDLKTKFPRKNHLDNA